MLEKYKNLDHILNEPLDFIKKNIVDNKSIICGEDYLLETTRIKGSNYLIRHTLNNSGLSINRVTTRPNIRDLRKLVKKDEFLNRVLNKKKVTKFSNINIAKSLIIKLLKSYYPNNEIFVEDTAVTIHYPEIEIKNSKGLKHTLLDVYVKYKIGFKVTVEVVRTTFLKAEIAYDYFHSHYSGMPHRWTSLRHFCLGTNPLKGLLTEGASTPSELRLLIKGVYEVLSWESLEGGPYKHINKLFREMVNFVPIESPPYDEDSTYLELLYYLKDKPGCITFSGSKVFVNSEYIIAFCRESDDVNLHGYFTDGNEVAKPVLKDYGTIYDTLNDRVYINNEEVKVKAIQHSSIDNIIISKDLNEPIINKLIDKITKDLNDAIKDTIKLNWENW